MSETPVIYNTLRPSERAIEFYGSVMRVLQAAGIPFLVGGGFAMQQYTGIVRRTKDLDLFVRPEHVDSILGVLREEGFKSSILAVHWLGKVTEGELFVDIIFGAGNGLAPVDDDWFRHSVPANILGEDVLLCPAEETLWSKSFVCERERYDGADVVHLIRARAESLDWARLLRRYGDHWRVLLSHLIQFGYVYPGERNRVPPALMQDLIDRLAGEIATAPPVRVCRGTLLSKAQYEVDVEAWGYHDGRPVVTHIHVEGIPDARGGR